MSPSEWLFHINISGRGSFSHHQSCLFLSPRFRKISSPLSVWSCNSTEKHGCFKCIQTSYTCLSLTPRYSVCFVWTNTHIHTHTEEIPQVAFSKFLFCVFTQVTERDVAFLSGWVSGAKLQPDRSKKALPAQPHVHLNVRLVHSLSLCWWWMHTFMVST